MTSESSRKPQNAFCGTIEVETQFYVHFALLFSRFFKSMQSGNFTVLVNLFECLLEQFNFIALFGLI